MNNVQATDNAFCGLLTGPYAAAVAFRNALFDRGLKKIHRLPKPVISIGNLTTGGTGKTPMVVHVAQRLMNSAQHRPAVLLRGYKSVAGISDEAMLLQDELGSSVPVQPNPNRVTGANSVLSRHPDITVFILDDGFQHRRVYRDLDIVLIDATNPFGGGRLLPRGRLREPAANLSRAHAVVVTRADQVDSAALAALDQTIAALHGRPPIVHAAHTWQAFRDEAGAELPLAALASTPTVGICGIGNPHGFQNSLSNHTNLRHLAAFPDHHNYADRDALLAAITAGQRAGAAAILTTEKDWVKWRRLNLQLPLPVYRPILRITLLKGAAELDALLAMLSP